MVKEFAYVLLALKFQVPGGVLCKSGEQSSGRLLQFAGQGGAEEWLGLGQNLKDSFLHGAPPELGLASGLGFTVCTLGFPYPLEVFEVTQHLLPGVSRKIEVPGRYLTGRIFPSALGS